MNVSIDEDRQVQLVRTSGWKLAWLRPSTQAVVWGPWVRSNWAVAATETLVFGKIYIVV